MTIDVPQVAMGRRLRWTVAKKLPSIAKSIVYAMIGMVALALVRPGTAGFTPEAVGDLIGGSGTFIGTPGSAIMPDWYADPTNTQGSLSPTDKPGILVGTHTFTGTTLLQLFAVDRGPFAVGDADPFSMTLQLISTFRPGGSLVGRGQTEIAKVPEPARLFLLGAGIAGLGLAWRSRKPPGRRISGRAFRNCRPANQTAGNINSVVAPQDEYESLFPIN